MEELLYSDFSCVNRKLDLVFVGVQTPKEKAQMVKCLSIVQETRIRLLGREDPLEKAMETHSSTLKRISASVKIACQLKQPNNSKPLARFHLLFRQVCRGQTCRMGERRSTFVLIGLVGKKKESIFGFGSS